MLASATRFFLFLSLEKTSSSVFARLLSLAGYMKDHIKWKPILQLALKLLTCLITWWIHAEPHMRMIRNCIRTSSSFIRLVAIRFAPFLRWRHTHFLIVRWHVAQETFILDAKIIMARGRKQAGDEVFTTTTVSNGQTVVDTSFDCIISDALEKSGQKRWEKWTPGLSNGRRDRTLSRSVAGNIVSRLFK